MTDDLEDISARVGRMEDLSSERLHQDQMARLSPSRLGDAGMPPEPTVGASPFDVAKVIADGAVGAAALAANVFAAPTVGLGTAAAVGAASTLIRSDATIAAFDATVPVTQAFADAAATGVAGVAARRDHRHGMPTTSTAAHEAASDPHTGYQKESEVGVWYAKAYGATGNGTTNDAAAIQAAMDACGLAGGGEVSVPPGDFELGTTSLQFKYSNIRVIGSGKHLSATSIATRLTYTGGGAMFENSDTATPTVRHYCGVQNMTLDFSGATTGACALRINAFRSGMWRDLYILSSSTGAAGTWRGIWMTGGTNNETYFNKFDNVDIALTGAAGTQWCVDMDGFWVNRNNFIGGIWEGNNANALRIGPASSFSDTNTFIGIGFQTHGTTIIKLGGSGGQANDNTWLACHFEPTTASVITFATASGEPQRNQFLFCSRSNTTFSDPSAAGGNTFMDFYGFKSDIYNSSDPSASMWLRGYQSGLTIGRSDGASGVLTLGESNYTTAPAANFVQILAKDVSGVTKLRARFSDGSEWDLAPLAGTAFPATPSTNDKFWRTDRRIEYFYDGTRWLSVQLFDHNFEVEGAAADGRRRGATWEALYDVWLVDWQTSGYVGTPLDASNYWKLHVEKWDAATLTSITSIQLSGTADTFIRGYVAIGALLGTSIDALSMGVFKTGAPGVLYAGGKLTYRLVG